MKKGKTTWVLALTIATMAFLTQQAHALFTPELAGVSNLVAVYLTTLTNTGDRAEAKAVADALKGLSKPSTSVAQDYDLFVAASLKLGQFALQPPLFALGTNTLLFFLNAAEGQIGAAFARIGALNDFVKTKNAAIKQLEQAAATLSSALTNPNPQSALMQGRLVFSRVATANKLASIGEAHPGFARESIYGTDLEYAGKHGSGTIVFVAESAEYFQNEEGNSHTGMHLYQRTGLNTGAIRLMFDNGGTPAETLMKLTFKSAGGGKVSSSTTGADVPNNAGSFTIEND